MDMEGGLEEILPRRCLQYHNSDKVSLAQSSCITCGGTTLNGHIVAAINHFHLHNNFHCMQRPGSLFNILLMIMTAIGTVRFLEVSKEWV